MPTRRLSMWRIKQLLTGSVKNLGALRRELECLVAEASPSPLWSGISHPDEPAKGKQAAPGF